MYQFVILHEDFQQINFVAKAVPGNGSFKIKWTKQNERGVNFDRIYIKIYEIHVDGQEYRRRNLEPQSFLGPHNYKWDIGRGWDGREVFPNLKYNVRIYLQHWAGGQNVYEVKNCQCYIYEEQFYNLKTKAVNFCLRKYGGMDCMRKFTDFYRSDEIIDNVDNGRRQFAIEAKQKLANQGHMVPGVERISGIFFFARDCEPNLNPFGGRRYAKFPIESLIDDPRMFNFYFMDIKCYNYVIHYITIAIARNGSDEERYGNKRLLKLNILDNPFLCVEYNRRTRKYDYFVPGDPLGGYSKCFIEIFFMRKEPLIFNRNQIDIMEPGASANRGIPKDDCRQCCLLTRPSRNLIRTESLEWIYPWGPSNSFRSPSYPSTPEP